MSTLKEEFRLRDRLIRGITDDKFFKISVVKSTSVVRDAQTKHALSPLSTVILGKALTGSLLIASTLKGEERLSVRLDGDGPVGSVIVEANAVGAVRGFVANADASLDFSNPETTIGDALGNGTLTLAKVLYNEARPVTGTVELRRESIEEALAHYMEQSEQIASAIILDVEIDDAGKVVQAGGILIQALPNAPLDGMVKLQQAIESLPRLSKMYSDGGYIDTILASVGGEIGAKELNRMMVDFFCSCTEDGFIRALKMLSTGELKEMAGKPQELVCHYCSKKYPISGDKMTAIYNECKVKMN